VDPNPLLNDCAVCPCCTCGVISASYAWKLWLLIAEKYSLTKAATALASGFCPALAETVTDPTVDTSGVGLGVATGEGAVGGAEDAAGDAEEVVGGAKAEPEPWAA
jgi:hypothetical protein